MPRSSTRRADIGVTIAVCLLMSTFTLAQLNRAREVAERVKCASNLRQIGQAMLLYSNDNRGVYPRTYFKIDDPQPTWGTPYEGDEKLRPEKHEKADPFDAKNSRFAVKPNDVTAGLFLLLRTQDITSEVFVCPTSGAEKWDYGGGTHSPLDWSNWPGTTALRDHLSYSYQNPYPTKDAIGKGWKFNNTLGAEYAVAADLNPGGEGLTRLTATSEYKAMKTGNSPNHDRDGQNVLYGDGHVAFEMNPFVGVKRDNIYTFGDSGKDKGGDGIVGAPVGPEDSILLPTAEDIGVITKQGTLTKEMREKRDKRAGRAPATPEELAAARDKFVGSYTREGRDKTALKLQISKEQVKFTRGAGEAIAFDYRLTGLVAGGAGLELVAPGEQQAVELTVWPDQGVIFIAGDERFAGRWTRE